MLASETFVILAYFLWMKTVISATLVWSVELDVNDGFRVVIQNK